MESNLVVPTGISAGKPFRLHVFQRKFLNQLINPNVAEAGLSIARKNGKSATIAAFLIAYTHPESPIYRPKFRALITSLTARLAAELRAQVMDIAEASGFGENFHLIKYPVPGKIEAFEDGLIEFLAADKSTGHASSADLAIFDELGLTDESHRDLVNAMRSSVSGRDGKFVAISIKGTSPLFDEMKQRADGETFIFHEYVSDPDAPIDCRKNWKASNPGLGLIKSEKYMRNAAQAALLTPGNERGFRAYDLNQSIETERETLFTPTQWKITNVDIAPLAEGPVVLGLDLGGSTSMTAAAAYWYLTGRIEVWGAFGDTPALAERSKADRVGDLYLAARDRGELTLYPGLITPVDEFLFSLQSRLAEQEVRAVCCDRFRKAELEQAMSAASVFWPIIYRGQGFKDGSADIIDAQKEVLSGRVKTPRHVLLETAISETIVTRDPAGNGKLDKRRQQGRIDAASAFVQAVAVGRRYREQPGGVRIV